MTSNFGLLPSLRMSVKYILSGQSINVQKFATKPRAQPRALRILYIFNKHLLFDTFSETPCTYSNHVERNSNQTTQKHIHFQIKPKDRTASPY